MIRLNLSREPSWLDLGHDVRVRVAPLTTSLMAAARSDPAVAALPEGASNENIERLQANLDVIQGGSSGGDAAAERRIKEQAKARAVDDYQRQEKTKQKAEEYRASGEYDKAEAEYEKALEIGERLALLEQEESVEQKRTNEALALEYKSVQDVKKRRSSSFGGKRSKKKEAKAGRFASFGPGSTDDAVCPSVRTRC